MKKTTLSVMDVFMTMFETSHEVYLRESKSRRAEVAEKSYREQFPEMIKNGVHVGTQDDYANYCVFIKDFV